MANAQVMTFDYQYNIPGETTTFTWTVRNNAFQTRRFLTRLVWYGTIINTIYPPCNSFVEKFYTEFDIGPNETKTFTYTENCITYGQWMAGAQDLNAPGTSTYSRILPTPTIRIHTNFDYLSEEKPNNTVLVQSGYGNLDGDTFVFDGYNTTTLDVVRGNNYTTTLDVLFDKYGPFTECRSSSCCGGPSFPNIEKFKICSIIKDYDTGEIYSIMVVDENLNVIYNMGLGIRSLSLFNIR